MNKVIISGRFTKDHELKYTSTGTAILSNAIASTRKYKNTNGEYDSDFVNVVMFNQQAKYCADYSNKGDKALIEGRLQTRTYDNNEGKKVYVTEIIVDSVELLTTKQTNNNQVSNNNQTNQVNVTKPVEKNQDPFEMFGQINGTGVDISDDMLPF